MVLVRLAKRLGAPAPSLTNPPPIPTTAGKPAPHYLLRASPEVLIPAQAVQLSQNATAVHTTSSSCCQAASPGSPSALIPRAPCGAGAGVQDPRDAQQHGAGSPAAPVLGKQKTPGHEGNDCVTCAVPMSPCRQGPPASPGPPAQPHTQARDAAGTLGWQLRCCSCPPSTPRGANKLLRDPSSGFRARVSPSPGWDAPQAPTGVEVPGALSVPGLGHSPRARRSGGPRGTQRPRAGTLPKSPQEGRPQGHSGPQALRPSTTRCAVPVAESPLCPAPPAPARALATLLGKAQRVCY